MMTPNQNTNDINDNNQFNDSLRYDSDSTKSSKHNKNNEKAELKRSKQMLTGLKNEKIKEKTTGKKNDVVNNPRQNITTKKDQNKNRGTRETQRKESKNKTNDQNKTLDNNKVSKPYDPADALDVLKINDDQSISNHYQTLNLELKDKNNKVENLQKTNMNQNTYDLAEISQIDKVNNVERKKNKESEINSIEYAQFTSAEKDEGRINKMLQSDFDSTNDNEKLNSIVDMRELDNAADCRDFEKNENKRADILKNLLGKLQKTEDKLKVKLLDKLKGELQRSSDVARIEGASWQGLQLSNSLIRLLEGNDFVYPSPVQVHTIPKALAGDDLLVRAKNGTGKTLSYVIPIIEMMLNTKQENISEFRNFALVLVPTRELAMQVGKVFRKIGVHCREAIMSTFGGSNYYEDILRIEKGVGVIVGTPGRLFDLIDKNVIKLEKFRILVFDEADKILSKDFTENIEQIVYKFNYNRDMPETYKSNNKMIELLKKQVFLISATFPVEIFEFVRKHMNKAKEINLMPELHLKGLKSFYVRVEEERKLHCLKTILCKLKYQKLIIFCNSVVSTEKLGYRVLEMDFPCYYFHSKMSFDERKSIFHKFSTSHSEICVLVATDLITRGIDVPEVNVVINFNLPKSVESFLHRIGRAGRFGTTGCVVNLCNDEEIDDLTWLERQTGIQVRPISDPLFKDFTKSSIKE